MNWGKGIVIAFVLFAGFIFTLVGICIRQDVSLVSDDYYQQEINYDKQLDRLSNTRNLTEKPEIVVSSAAGTVSIRFPESLPRVGISGNVHFFRPSDAKLDVTYPLKLNDSGLQKLDISKLTKGLWTLKFTWSFEGKEYFEEQNLVL